MVQICRMHRFRMLFAFGLYLVASLQVICGDESPKIVIVGAGASGIAAAVKLIQKGVDDITILEAEDRIGGRIFTTNFGDFEVDLGAQWVIGEKGNPVWDMAWPLDLLGHSDDTFVTYHFYTSDGKAIDVDKYKNLTEHFRLLYLDPKFVNENNDTFGQIGEKELANFFTDSNEHQKEMMHWLNQMISSGEFADSWNDFIPDNTPWGVEGDWAMHWKDKGFSIILDIMMKKYPDPSQEIPVMEKIKLNTEVTKIDYTDDDGKVKVNTKDGETFEADDVIVTPSLGVLKATHETLFDPPLPGCKINVIEHLGYGDGTKIFLLFDNAWWNDIPNTNGFSILWTEKDMEDLKNNPDKEWQLYLLGFFKLARGDNRNILEMWINGKGARLVEQIPEDKLMEQIMELMQIFKEDKTVEAPKQMLRSTWHSNKHFRGSDVYRNIDSWKHDIKMDVLQQPLPKDKPVKKVWFAGDAVDPHSYGSVNGAINSGRRQAGEILEKYGKNDA